MSKKKIIVHYALNIEGESYRVSFDTLCGMSTGKYRSLVGIRNEEWVNCKRCLKSINSKKI